MGAMGCHEEIEDRPETLSSRQEDRSFGGDWSYEASAAAGEAGFSTAADLTIDCDQCC